jgi:hypothetical protein
MNITSTNIWSCGARCIVWHDTNTHTDTKIHKVVYRVALQLKRPIYLKFFHTGLFFWTIFSIDFYLVFHQKIHFCHTAVAEMQFDGNIGVEIIICNLTNPGGQHYKDRFTVWCKINRKVINGTLKINDSFSLKGERVGTQNLNQS